MDSRCHALGEVARQGRIPAQRPGAQAIGCDTSRNSRSISEHLSKGQTRDVENQDQKLDAL